MNVLTDSPPPFEAIIFDCDSTLSAIEGIDELAVDHADEIAALTNAAMSGEVPLESVYAKRLELIRPTRAAIEAVGALYIERCLKNVRELVDALHFLEKRVYVVSGGVRAAVSALAEHLGIADERVHAVEVLHTESGEYAGFNESNPLARNGGKPEILRGLREPAAVLIGDGTSDLEAAGLTKRFIAFGGVVNRPAVASAAEVTCEANDFAALLPLLCDRRELARLAESPQHEPLVRSAPNSHSSSE